MKFNKIHNSYFNSVRGAYSIVTGNEYEKGQITFTGAEAELLTDHFGAENILRGPKKLDPNLASKTYRLFNTNSYIQLTTNFPKGAIKDELRLYPKKSVNFSPPSGHIWFIFERENELWVGHMSKEKWRLSGLSGGSGRSDIFDSFYQESIYSDKKVEQKKFKERDIYSRDRKIALDRIKESNYKCEINDDHSLFVSRFSKNP